MTRYTSRADLLIAAGESIKMQTFAGIEPCLKYQGQIAASLASSGLFGNYDEYEFPIAVIEGKPAFCGDVLYDFRGERFVIGDQHREHILQPEVSWNPPKPKTVMVELLREDAEWFVARATADYWTEKESIRTADACRKALEKA